jgi:hypothetical protein
MRVSFKLLATTAILTFMASSASAATDLKFVLTGDYGATWTLPASPVPSAWSIAAFRVSAVGGTWGGTIAVRNLLFSAKGGGMLIDGSPFDFASQGQGLFTGPTSAPDFRTGTFNLTRLSPNQAGNGTLTISNAIPEPATWAMLIAGFGLVGMAARRRRETVAG